MWVILSFQWKDGRNRASTQSFFWHQPEMSFLRGSTVEWNTDHTQNKGLGHGAQGRNDRGRTQVRNSTTCLSTCSVSPPCPPGECCPEL